MTATRYTYPDEDDRITLRFIEQAEPYPGYWAESDERAMTRAAARLGPLLGARETVRALDLGCGKGRMLPWLSRLAGRITAADPDTGRLAEAARVTSGIAGAEIELVAADVHTLAGGPFDLVLCSHIIQHIPTAELVPLLTRLHERTAPGGFLMLTYTRSCFPGEWFSLERIDEHGVEERPVDRAEFDEVARDGGEFLPVHHRDRAQLAGIGRVLGWSEFWSWSFHVLGDRPGFAGHDDRDELVNRTPDLLRRFGRDVVVLWRR